MFKELASGERVDCVVFCKQAKKSLTKSGKVYYSLQLSDGDATLHGMVWDEKFVRGTVGSGDVVHVAGILEEYKGSLQIKVSSVCKDSSKSVEDFLPHTNFDIDTMWSSLMQHLALVKDKWCAELLNSFFGNKDFKERFCKHSAAVSVHHAFVGGLLEHTLHVVANVVVVQKLYPSLNLDLLITAAALHDVGKMYEIQPFPVNEYSSNGEFIGHVSESAMLVREHCNAIQNFPRGIRDRIVHCILSHHGKLEWGSPKLPAMPEAVLISRMDELDSQMKIFEDALKQPDVFNKYLGVRPMTGAFDEETQ